MSYLNGHLNLLPYINLLSEPKNILTSDASTNLYGEAVESDNLTANARLCTHLQVSSVVQSQRYTYSKQRMTAQFQVANYYINVSACDINPVARLELVT